MLLLYVISAVDNKKVRDHCYFLGDFRGAAHNRCNLNFKIDPKRWKLPIFFRNLKGDGHILIRAVNERYGNVRVIPTNMEKYKAFSIGQLQFLDTFQFTMKSLDELVSTLDDNDFKFTQEAFYLMKKKGVFPYDYFNDISKLDSNVFPSREAFFNKLSNSECSMKDFLIFFYLCIFVQGR